MSLPVGYAVSLLGRNDEGRMVHMTFIKQTSGWNVKCGGFEYYFQTDAMPINRDANDFAQYYFANDINRVPK